MRYRYDIRHDWYTDKWQVIDLGNHNCPVSSHDSRKEALAEAKRRG